MYFDIIGITYEKSIIMFKFLAYYVIPLCVIASFYLNMAWNLNLSTRNMPGIQNGGAELHDEQIQARKRVNMKIYILKFQIIKFILCTITVFKIQLPPIGHLCINNFVCCCNLIGEQDGSVLHNCLRDLLSTISYIYAVVPLLSNGS